MRALWLENQRLRFRDDLPMPLRSEGEALVRVRLVGICGTDLELLRGYYPYAGIPGHEFVGDVIEADDQRWIGERVVGEINAACGQCEPCRRGMPTHCERRSVLGIRDRAGAFAEFLCLPEANLHAVPAGVTDEAAVFVEPLAAALRIQEQVPIGRGDRVLVVGAGRLGQLIVRTLASSGCELHVIARHDAQRAHLRAAGIEYRAEDRIPPHRYDLVVEASGSPAGLESALAAVRPRGTVVLKSTFRGSFTVDPATLVVNEIKLVGSRCGPFAPALSLLETGRIDPSPLIDAVLPLDAGIAAFERAAMPGALKFLLKP